MDQLPLVSVLMTAYNREKFLAEAIQSVLDSTYSNFELIIVDDASNDSTVDIAHSFSKNDSRIRVYINEKNLGDYANRNKSSSYAVGEFLMSVDSDDRILKDGIYRCVQTMLSFPNSSFGIYLPSYNGCAFSLDSQKALHNHFFHKPVLNIGPGGTILRRTFFEEISRYPDKYGPANDNYFNLKAACFSPVVFLPFEFVFYRRHEGQEINNRFSYLIYNYTYLRDALFDLPLQLEKNQMEWLHKKNKRRFVVNITKYFFEFLDLKKIKQAINKASFSFTDALIGIFHW